MKPRLPLVILIQPKTEKKEFVYAPLGLLHLAAYLRSEYEVAIIDFRIQKSYKEILSELLERKPVAIGITAFTGGQILNGLEISEYIKKTRLDIPVIWGGIHATMFPKQTLANPYIDIVVKNEGEITLYETLHSIQNGSELNKVAGIAYKEDSRVFENSDRQFLDMDKLPIPTWDLIDLKPYISNLSIDTMDRPINISTSRGCPYRCTFCYNANFNRSKWRCKNALLVIEELKYLTDRHKVNRIIFHDDNFATDKKRALEIAKRIKQERLNIKWSVTLRIDDVDKRFLLELIEAGMHQLRVGIESGSQRILNMLKKDITVEQIIDSAKILNELDLDVLYSFVIGWPYETEDDRNRTVNLIFKLLKINPLAHIFPLWIYTPYPGTKLYEEARKLGFDTPRSLEEWGNFNWEVANIPWVKDIATVRAMQVLSNFAFYSRSINNLFVGYQSRRVHFKIIIRRIGTLLISWWARFRFKKNFWIFPYEQFILKKIINKV